MMTLPFKTKTLRRRASRARSRGAALVEAAVVIPVMLVFLGLIMFTYRSYAMKMDQQTTLRASVLSYASHDCEGGMQDMGDITAEDPSGGGAASTSPLERPAGNLKMKETGIGAFTPTVNRATGRKSAIAQGSAANDRKLVTFSRPVTTMSTVACNQKAYKNGFWGLLQAAGDFAAAGGKGIF